MKVTYKSSIEYRVIQIIEKVPHRILLRKDFSDLGSYRQVSRVLKKLVEQKQLVKIAFGIYAKAYTSDYIEEPLIEGGFDTVSREALDRIGVQWEPGSAEQAYNNGESQQVPTQNVIRLKSRFRRTIYYGNRKLYFEGNSNAR